MPNVKRNRSPHLIEGRHAIARYLNRAPGTISRWIALGILPVGRMPDGTLATTPALLERWLLASDPRKGRAMPKYACVRQDDGTDNGREI